MTPEQLRLGRLAAGEYDEQLEHARRRRDDLEAELADSSMVARPPAEVGGGGLAFEVELADFGDRGRVVIRGPSTVIADAGFRRPADLICEVCVHRGVELVAPVSCVSSRLRLCHSCAYDRGIR